MKSLIAAILLVAPTVAWAQTMDDTQMDAPQMRFASAQDPATEAASDDVAAFREDTQDTHMQRPAFNAATTNDHTTTGTEPQSQPAN